MTILKAYAQDLAITFSINKEGKMSREAAIKHPQGIFFYTDHPCSSKREIRKWKDVC